MTPCALSTLCRLSLHCIEALAAKPGCRCRVPAENEENRANWQQPDVIGKQVISNYHKFLAALTVLKGLVVGKTILPLPPDDPRAEVATDKAGMGAHDKERLHTLEDAVVSWMHQIKLVMDDDPEKLLHSSEHPGAGKQVTYAGPAETLHPKPGTPVAQVEFWHAKAVSLNNINE